jgi:hypothetical protein
MKRCNGESVQPIRVSLEPGARRLDCYEFCLLSLGETVPRNREREDLWEYAEECEYGGDEHGYQII